MADKGHQSVPYMFKDDEMEANFKNNFFRRAIDRGRSFLLGELHLYSRSLQYLRVFGDIYTGVVPTFYNTLAAIDEDNTFLKSIIGSFEHQVLPPNDIILCHRGEKWWKELGVTEAEVVEKLTGNKRMGVQDIQTASLLLPIRAIYLVVQHTMLPRNGNMDVMSEIDQMAYSIS